MRVEYSRDLDIGHGNPSGIGIFQLIQPKFHFLLRQGDDTFGQLLSRPKPSEGLSIILEEV